MSHKYVELEALNWDKVNGLMPAVIQDASTLQVIMLGYMNKEALEQSIATGLITFYSRTKNRLWTKGESSGNRLTLVNIVPDCDKDTLLIQAKPTGPSCHLNNRSCFGKTDAPGLGVLAKLEAIIDQRYQERPENSYVTTLFEEGIRRIAQKVGEEGVEVALACVAGTGEEIKNEAADLIFHLLVLLRQCEIELSEVMDLLCKRAEH
jgi:phosphoribosyl-ATP pyrophosphohydrolase/phosphoribosyl-AMP cyclohydrolase